MCIRDSFGGEGCTIVLFNHLIGSVSVRDGAGEAAEPSTVAEVAGDVADAMPKRRQILKQDDDVLNIKRLAEHTLDTWGALQDEEGKEFAFKEIMDVFMDKVPHDYLWYLALAILNTE